MPVWPQVFQVGQNPCCGARYRHGYDLGVEVLAVAADQDANKWLPEAFSLERVARWNDPLKNRYLRFAHAGLKGFPDLDMFYWKL